jgi:hypothetical protein
MIEQKENMVSMGSAPCFNRPISRPPLIGGGTPAISPAGSRRAPLKQIMVVDPHARRARSWRKFAVRAASRASVEERVAAPGILAKRSYLG